MLPCLNAMTEPRKFGYVERQKERERQQTTRKIIIWVLLLRCCFLLCILYFLGFLEKVLQQDDAALKLRNDKKKIELGGFHLKFNGVFFSTIFLCTLFKRKNAVLCLFLKNVLPSKRVLCFILNNLHFQMVKGIAFYALYKLCPV